MCNINEDVLTNVFFDDGSLRDIYIEQTNLNDWISIWEFVKGLSISINGETETINGIPEDVSEIFKARKEVSIYLTIDYKGVVFNCHFFCIEEIEFNVCPRGINNLMEAKAVFDFMEKLSNLLCKDVSISIENFKEDPLITVTSKGEYITYYR
jgi:hypothetical protein